MDGVAIQSIGIVEADLAVLRPVIAGGSNPGHPEGGPMRGLSPPAIGAEGHEGQEEDRHGRELDDAKTSSRPP